MYRQLICTIEYMYGNNSTSTLHAELLYTSQSRPTSTCTGTTCRSTVGQAYLLQQHIRSLSKSYYSTVHVLPVTQQDYHLRTGTVPIFRYYQAQIYVLRTNSSTGTSRQAYQLQMVVHVVLQATCTYMQVCSTTSSRYVGLQSRYYRYVCTMQPSNSRLLLHVVVATYSSITKSSTKYMYRYIHVGTLTCTTCSYVIGTYYRQIQLTVVQYRYMYMQTDF